MGETHQRSLIDTQSDPRATKPHDLREIFQEIKDLRHCLRDSKSSNETEANPALFTEPITNPAPSTSPAPLRPPDPPDFGQSNQISTVKATPKVTKSSTTKLRKYSCEEAYDRMTNGLCMFCDELDTPGHYLKKHNRSKILMIECDEDQFYCDEAMETNSSTHEIGSNSVNNTIAETIQDEDSSLEKKSRQGELYVYLDSVVFSEIYPVLQVPVILVQNGNQVNTLLERSIEKPISSSNLKNSAKAALGYQHHSAPQIYEIDSSEAHVSVGLTNSVLAASDFVYKQEMLLQFRLAKTWRFKFKIKSKTHKFTGRMAEDVEENFEKLPEIDRSLDYVTDLSFIRDRPVDFNFRRKPVFEIHWYGFLNSWENDNLNMITMSGFLLSEKGIMLFVSQFGNDQRGNKANDNRFLCCFMAVAANIDLDWALCTLAGSYHIRENNIGWTESVGVLVWSWSRFMNSTILQMVSTIQLLFQQYNYEEFGLSGSVFDGCILLNLIDAMYFGGNSGGRKLLVSQTMQGNESSRFYSHRVLLLTDKLIFCLQSYKKRKTAKLLVIFGVDWKRLIEWLYVVNESKDKVGFSGMSNDKQNGTVHGAESKRLRVIEAAYTSARNYHKIRTLYLGKVFEAKDPERGFGAEKLFHKFCWTGVVVILKLFSPLLNATYMNNVIFRDKLSFSSSVDGRQLLAWISITVYVIRSRENFWTEVLEKPLCFSQELKHVLKSVLMTRSLSIQLRLFGMGIKTVCDLETCVILVMGFNGDTMEFSFLVKAVEDAMTQRHRLPFYFSDTFRSLLIPAHIEAELTEITAHTKWYFLQNDAGILILARNGVHETKLWSWSFNEKNGSVCDAEHKRLLDNDVGLNKAFGLWELNHLQDIRDGTISHKLYLMRETSRNKSEQLKDAANGIRSELIFGQVENSFTTFCVYGVFHLQRPPEFRRAKRYDQEFSQAFSLSSLRTRMFSTREYCGRNPYSNPIQSTSVQWPGLTISFGLTYRNYM